MAQAGIYRIQAVVSAKVEIPAAARKLQHYTADSRTLNPEAEIVPGSQWKSACEWLQRAATTSSARTFHAREEPGFPIQETYLTAYRPIVMPRQSDTKPISKCTQIMIMGV